MLQNSIYVQFQSRQNQSMVLTCRRAVPHGRRLWLKWVWGGLLDSDRVLFHHLSDSHLLVLWKFIKMYPYNLCNFLYVHCIFMKVYGEGNGTPLQYSCLENSVDGEAWWAAVHGIAKSDTTGQLHFHFSLTCTGEGNGNPLQCSCLENPRDRRAW